MSETENIKEELLEHDHEHEHEHEHEHDHEENGNHKHVKKPEHHAHADHDHDCCCDHDHEEEHDHDHDHHDHECGCGCDHDHDHEDGHHHHHDEGHKYNVEGYRLVETHKHEGATVCSFERDTQLSGTEAKAAMEEAFTAVKDWLNAQGAIIGHVKGYIKENGKTVTFSTVGAELNTTEHEGIGCQVAFAAIVFGPDEETLKDKVILEFARLS